MCYPDDFLTYVESKPKARRIHHWVINYLKSHLKLPVGGEKSRTRSPVQFELSGLGFVPDYCAFIRGRYQLVVRGKAWQPPKQSLEAITRKTAPVSFTGHISKLL